jgi:hypothetical protein
MIAAAMKRLRSETGAGATRPADVDRAPGLSARSGTRSPGNSDQAAARRGRASARSAQLRDADGDRDGGRKGRQGGQDQHELVPADERRPEATDRRSEEDPTHLGRVVEAEDLARPPGRRRVVEVAAGRRVVHRRPETGQSPQGDEGDGRREDRHRTDRRPGHDQSEDHERHPGGAVRERAEERLREQPRRGPGGDDDPEQGDVDAVLGEVERHDREERPEPRPEDELGGEERQDAAPAGKPGRDSAEGAGDRGTGRHGSAS